MQRKIIYVYLISLFNENLTEKGRRKPPFSFEMHEFDECHIEEGG